MHDYSTLQVSLQFKKQNFCYASYSQWNQCHHVKFKHWAHNSCSWVMPLLIHNCTFYKRNGGCIHHPQFRIWICVLGICSSVCTPIAHATNPNSIITMDNASIHHIDPVFKLITATGALVKFLPPYSPDLNPIEEVFAEVKHYMEAKNTTT